MKTYVSLGSNLDNPIQHVSLAIEELAMLPLTTRRCISSLYRTPPLGPASQPDFINAVIGLETELTPHALLQALQAIEQQHGRVRAERWGPRTLDLDILLYASLAQQDATLTLPHPGLTQRAFVLLPLFEIAPDLQLPDGRWLRDCLKEVNSDGIVIAQR